MPLTEYPITGDLLDALGGPAALGTVTLTPFGSHEARVDGDNVRLGFIRYDFTELPDPLPVTAGAWTVQIDTTGQINGRRLFQPITRHLTIDGPLTWGEIVDGAVTDVPLTPSLVQQAADARAAAELAETNAEAAAASVNRGQPNGTAPLDAGSKVPDANLPTRLSDLALTATYATTVKAKAQQWIESWNREAFLPPQPQDTPVVTWFNAMTTTLTTPVVTKPEKVGLGSQTTTWDGQSDPKFRFPKLDYETKNGGSQDLGLYGKIKPGGAAQFARWYLDATFVTSSTDTVEIAGYSLTTTKPIGIEVDGRILSEPYISSPFISAAGNWMVKLVFPTAAVRTIRFYSGGELGLSEVRVPTGSSISKPSSAINRRVAFIGDSWVNGAGASTERPYSVAGALGHETYAARFGRLLACDEFIHAGIGGTGFVAGMDGGTPNPYSTRLTMVLATNPHVLVVQGSINDGVGAGAIQAAVEAFLTTAASVSKVIVIGTPLTAYGANHDAVKAGALAKGRTFIDMKDFVYGTGNVAAPTGDGNRDMYLRSDNSHMTLAGHRALARAAYERLMA